MPSNFELYKNIHKGQRREMFRISEMAGLAGPEDPEDVKRLNARIASFRDEMHNHAHMEEVHIHPLLGQRVPGGTRKLEEDHVVMHRQLDEILAMADTMLGSSVPPTESKAMFQELYLAWNRFVAFYLQHIDTEEERAQTELWKLCSEEEVRGIFGRILASEPREMLAIDAGLMLPAVSKEDRVEMVMALGNAPPEMLRMFGEIAQRVLEPQDYDDLRTKGGLP